MTFGAGPRHTVTEGHIRGSDTPNLGAQPFTIGPVDFPDTARDQAAGGARFLDAQRGYTATSPTDLEHYCLDCRFRPWADATGELIAFVTFRRRGGRLEVETVRYRDGRFVTHNRLHSGDSATIEIQDAWGDTTAEPAVVRG